MSFRSRALSALLLAVSPLALAGVAPLAPVPDLFDAAQPDTLGLAPAPNAHTVIVYHPGDADYRYNQGAVLTTFRGSLYLQWQSSGTDEGAPDTEVRYAVSDDEGETWSEPRLLAGPREGAVLSSGGWWTDGTSLVAYLNIQPDDRSPQGDHVAYVLSDNGLDWGEPRPLLGNDIEPVRGRVEPAMGALACGRILSAVQSPPGMMLKPYFTNDPLGIGGWRAGQMVDLPAAGAAGGALTSSWYQRADESVVMMFGDPEDRSRVLASESRDLGASWGAPLATDFPDASAGHSAGSLPDGRVFFVNSPHAAGDAIPLVVSLSDDGRRFDRAYRVRQDGGSPSSLVHGGDIYVAYTTREGAVAVTRIPSADL